MSVSLYLWLAWLCTMLAVFLVGWWIGKRSKGRLEQQVRELRNKIKEML